MDGERFDRLARSVAGGVSRRSLLRGVAAGLAAAVGATGAAAAACRPVGRSCREDANCCAGLCLRDDSGRRRCACPEGTVACGRVCLDPAAYQTDPANCGGCGVACDRSTCKRAICAAGLCGLDPDPAMIDRPCDDGDFCTAGDACLADGSCAGTPVACTAPNDCYTSGSCIPATGECGAPVYRGDGASCAGGVCAGGACVACTGDGDCDNLDGPCADGICNTTTGQCERRNKDNGAPCDDGDRCTIGGACSNGQCVSLGAVECDEPNECQTGPGVCDPQTGRCVYQERDDYSPCNGVQFCCGGVCCEQDNISCVDGACSGLCIPTGQGPCGGLGLACCNSGSGCDDQGRCR